MLRHQTIVTTWRPESSVQQAAAIHDKVVNLAITMGWQPLGGPTIVAGAIVQAIVRPDSQDAEQQAEQMLSDIRPLTDSRKG